ncbi:AAA family ATPase [Chitinophaga arvensicola]|uniref:HTH-type transcriptional regulator, transcriptional repressor of NAD biosynthesis genes n=1 Tax=Chitinophaga arvensicola TaxID=29529 RepID=A0A1I0S883_9BACT|nr:AAA family ATPase [Chitinophaga arvensicola]SEW52174.1 HTH-type transcriptional regulator, transcriptional repressor of NAD biosynthesis genes [Chitinophaga arvensicola]
MTKAFVFGKFMPFHKGHEAMINFALASCDFLSVLICCSNQERVPPPVRKAWLEETFRHIPQIEILTYTYDESILPNTSESSSGVSAIWATEFKQLFPDYQIVVTSEPYGDLVAGFMNIRHLPFNKEKNLYPVSATKIRTDLFDYWQWLPDAVKKSLAIKVVILGTESTGKTTLTGLLANYFHCSAVPEAGRDLIADSNDFGITDLYAIATEHAARINRIATLDSPLLIIDTDIHITLSYGEYAFGETLNIDPAVYASNEADLYLYLNNDVPYVQDGTRLSEEERNLLDNAHRRILDKYGIHCEEITGNWTTRFEQAVTLVKQLLLTKQKNWYTKTHLPSLNENL